MREIKFKFWDKHDKKFVAWPENMYIAGDGKIFTYENIEIDLKEEEIIPLQFTGLKDKNGKEIYEGDVVKGKFYDAKPETSKVEWHEKSGGFIYFGYPLNIHGLSGLEIIGNIHENPELDK